MYNQKNTLSLWLFCLWLCFYSFYYFVKPKWTNSFRVNYLRKNLNNSFRETSVALAMEVSKTVTRVTCPFCKIFALSEWNYTMNVNVCFSKCLLRNLVNFTYVWHDMCTFIHRVKCHWHCNQLVKGGAQLYYCNCVLLSQVCKQNAHGVCTYFRDWAVCWYCDLEVTQTPLIHFVQTKSTNKLLNQNITYDRLCDKSKGDVLKPTQTFTRN